MTETTTRLTVERLGAQGDGVGQLPAGTVFLPETAPGDTVDVTWYAGRKGPVVAACRLVAPSPRRVAPPCQHFSRCGGCTLQHVDASQYELFVTDKIRAAMAQHGWQDPPLAPPHISAPQSRRRLALTAVRAGKGVVLGFNQPRSHQVINVQQCPVARPGLVSLLPPLRDFLATALDAKTRAGILLTETATGVDAAISAGFEPGLAARHAAAELGEAVDLAAITWSVDGERETLIRRRRPEMVFEGLSVPLPAGAFIQATADGEQALRGIVNGACQDADHVADLFAGLGTFALPVSRSARIWALEGDASLLAALAQAANRAQGLKPIHTGHRDLFRQPVRPEELTGIDAVVIDPPRAGARAQSDALARSSVPVIAALSCNPATFARDARILADGGYRLENVQPVGQFLWSPHVELGAIFRR